MVRAFVGFGNWEEHEESMKLYAVIGLVALLAIGYTSARLIQKKQTSWTSLPLSEVIRTAATVEVYQKGPDQYGRYMARVASLDNGKTKTGALTLEATRFFEVKGASRFHNHRESAAKPDFTFAFIRDVDAPSRAYGYISTTGELGSGTEWCYVPNDIRAWIQSLKPHLATPKPFKIIRKDGIVIVPTSELPKSPAVHK